MNNVIQSLMPELEMHPVLVDIGASRNPPDVWEKIAPYSTYIGFDPDLREIHEEVTEHFGRKIFINKAITPNPGKREITFYLTEYPGCSSTLLPDTKSLQAFLFSDLFTLRQTITVGATTVNEILADLEIPKIDWLKTDSQGTDLRIFNSLSDDIRHRVLGVDVEPGLIDAYIDEDTFVETHRELLKQGFWLSNLNVCGTVKLHRITRDNLCSSDRGSIALELIRQFHRQSPGWCEARYFRTVEFLKQDFFNKSDYVMAWIFACADQQFGFALDLVYAYEQRFGKDSFSQTMLDETLLYIQQLRPKRSKLRKFVGRLLPSSIKLKIQEFVVPKHS